MSHTDLGHNQFFFTLRLNLLTLMFVRYKRNKNDKNVLMFLTSCVAIFVTKLHQHRLRVTLKKF